MLLDLILFILLLILYGLLTFAVIKLENNQNIFIDHLHWSHTIIFLGDEIIVETTEGLIKGFFRGLINQETKIIRLSTEGQPQVELLWTKVISITKSS